VEAIGDGQLQVALPADLVRPVLQLRRDAGQLEAGAAADLVQDEHVRRLRVVAVDRARLGLLRQADEARDSQVHHPRLQVVGHCSDRDRGLLDVPVPRAKIGATNPQIRAENKNTSAAGSVVNLAI